MIGIYITLTMCVAISFVILRESPKKHEITLRSYFRFDSFQEIEIEFRKVEAFIRWWNSYLDFKKTSPHHRNKLKRSEYVAWRQFFCWKKHETPMFFEKWHKIHMFVKRKVWFNDIIPMFDKFTNNFRDWTYKKPIDSIFSVPKFPHHIEPNRNILLCVDMSLWCRIHHWRARCYD